MGKERGSKRTTILFNDEDRKFLDELIREGKEPGIKPFISKMFDIYRSMAIYDWRYPGEYYSGVSRVAFFSQEGLRALTELISEKDVPEAGRRLGKLMRSSMESSHRLDSSKRENWPDMLKRLRIYGYGDIVLRGDIVVVRNPFIDNIDLLAGFLEELLGCKLNARTKTAPIVFELKP